MSSRFEENAARFAYLCEEEAEPAAAGQSIGTYGEKRLHRVVKRYICDNEDVFERKIGRYVADLCVGNMLYEIQTGSFRPLAEKLSYYLSETDYEVTVIYPVKAERMIYRMDPDTGELIRKRKSAVKGREIDLLPQLSYIAESVASPRVHLRVLTIRCDEFRFSERVRYRRSGAYVSELFPRELLSERRMDTAEDLEALLPELPAEFAAKDFSSRVGMKSREANAALRGLCALGLLDRRIIGRKYIYTGVRGDASAQKEK